MIPRLHKRGTSFKGAAAYLFHDKGHAQTAERVAWVHSENLWSHHAEQAWFEMMQTWQDRNALKQAAGVKRSGRDNTQPVLHLSLSWHEQDAPDANHMRETALGALKALGLQEHQALVIAHRDEPHPHVHLLVNTVHPLNGKTASLAYSKETLSKWAEAYQREQGHDHCPERVKNNARRDELKKQRAIEKERQVPVEQRKPFEPVKDRSPHRRAWFDKTAVVTRMKTLHRELSAEQKQEKDALWRSQQKARADLLASAEGRVDAIGNRTREYFKPLWSSLYREQKAEIRFVATTATHPFERAAFVFRNRERLSGSHKPLTLRQMIPLIMSPKKLRRAIDATHERERRSLGGQQQAQTKTMTERVWQNHRADMHALVAQQKSERDAQRQHHTAERGEVSFQKAKEDLAARPDLERSEGVAKDFAGASRDTPAQPRKEKRSERIIREMQEADRSGHKRGDFERKL